MTKELDVENDGSEIQEVLRQMTGQSTVPNIFIGGKHVGGCSDLKTKLRTGDLIELFHQAGIQHGF